jgi:hypothetical protein
MRPVLCVIKPKILHAKVVRKILFFSNLFLWILGAKNMGCN